MHSRGHRRLQPLAVTAIVALLGAFAAPAAAVDSVAVWLGYGNQVNANFGYSVATAGDVNGDGFSDLLVGARGYNAGQIDEGRALLYLGSADGPAALPVWTGESDQLLAFYGSSVASAGDVNGDGYHDVIVGAPSYDGALSNEGRVYLYLGGPSGPSASPDWTRDGGQAGATFGGVVAGAGDVNGDGYDDVLVGARGWDGAEANAGKAFLYAGGAAGLDTIPVWSIEGTQDDEALGWSVAAAGDVNGDGFADVIVGAFFHDGVATDEGAAWVYLGSATGLGTLPAWTVNGNQQGANLGWSVAGAGDVNGDGHADVIVGVRYHDAPLAKEGRALLYLGSAAGVDSTAAWTADGGQANAYFGWSVGAAGDVNGDGRADVVVGAYRADVSWIDDGEARLYLGTSSGLEPAPAWSGTSDQAGAGFGWSVAGAGDVDGDGFGDIVVGAHLHDDDQENEGSASVFRGAAEAPQAASWWKGSAGETSVAYGFALAYAGDVNGDGFTEVLVADPLADLTVSGEGRTDLFLGGVFGPDTSPTWSTGGAQPGENWGRAVAAAGDVDGDGYDDVLVGAPLYTNAMIQEGRVALFTGSPIGLSPLAEWERIGGSVGAELGAGVAGLGDVNGDGYADVAVGAPGLDGLVAGAGAVFIHHGGAGGPSLSADLLLGGAQTDARFGAALGPAGDVNGDGYADLIVGEPLATIGMAEEGRAHVYLGSPSGLDPAPVWTASGGESAAQFGAAVGPAGDVDGDGYADVVVVAPLADGAGADEGRAALFRGGPGGLSASPDWSWESGQPGAQLDVAAAAGDANADGFDDLLIGVSHHAESALLEGRVLLFLGSPSGLGASPAHEWLGGRVLARLGSALTGRGDPDGDGWPDLLFGARGWSDSSSSGGAAFLFATNGAPGGAARAARQWRQDDTAPIALGGWSDSESSFRLRALAGCAAGRSAVSLQWEVKPLGVPFDGSGLQTTPFLDSGAPQEGESRVELDGMVSGLAAGTPVRWRLRIQSPLPVFARSPWLTLPGNGSAEADLRLLAAVAVPEVGPAATAGPRLAAGPTPFREFTEVRFTLDAPSHVTLSVHDVAGRVVTSLRDGHLDAGKWRVPWDGRNRSGRPVAPGVYWVRLTTAPGRTGDAAAAAVSVIRLR